MYIGNAINFFSRNSHGPDHGAETSLGLKKKDGKKHFCSLTK
jgi:hypothetical protein